LRASLWGNAAREACMQEAFAGAWACEAQLSSSTLVSLYDLNYRFLDLCAARAADWPLPGWLKLPGDLPGQVVPLSDAQRAAAAHCPYALFDLRFQDEEHWRARLASAGEWRVADEVPIDDETGGFVRLALFFAWHVASSATFAAQLLLGMHEHTARAFRGATINCLPALVASEAANLSARWCNSNAYWS